MANSYNQLFGLGGHSPDANLAGHYACQDDAASTTVTDRSGNARHGTASHNTSTLSTTGPNSWLAKAFRFDGSDRSVDLGFAFNLGTSPGTLLLRAKNTNTSGVIPVTNRSATNTSGYEFLYNTGGAANDVRGRVQATSGGVVNGTSYTGITDGQWHTLGMNMTPGTNFVLYVGGTSRQTNAQTNSTVNGSQNLMMAKRGANFFQVDIAEVAVFTGRVLTDTEHANWVNGPELRYASGASFDEDGNFDVGTWALPTPFNAGSNGTPTYSVIAVNAAGDVLDTASTATGTLDISGEAGNTVYLLVRVANTGGYDIGDHGSRTSGYGSANDGYYELDSVTAAGGGGPTSRAYILSACGPYLIAC